MVFSNTLDPANLQRLDNSKENNDDFHSLVPSEVCPDEINEDNVDQDHGSMVDVDVIDGSTRMKMQMERIHDKQNGESRHVSAKSQAPDRNHNRHGQDNIKIHISPPTDISPPTTTFHLNQLNLKLNDVNNNTNNGSYSGKNDQLPSPLHLDSPDESSGRPSIESVEYVLPMESQLNSRTNSRGLSFSSVNQGQYGSMGGVYGGNSNNMGTGAANVGGTGSRTRISILSGGGEYGRDYGNGKSKRTSLTGGTGVGKGGSSYGKNNKSNSNSNSSSSPLAYKSSLCRMYVVCTFCVIFGISGWVVWLVTGAAGWKGKVVSNEDSDWLEKLKLGGVKRSDGGGGGGGLGDSLGGSVGGGIGASGGGASGGGIGGDRIGISEKDSLINSPKDGKQEDSPSNSPIGDLAAAAARLGSVRLGRGGDVRTADTREFLEAVAEEVAENVEGDATGSGSVGGAGVEADTTGTPVAVEVDSPSPKTPSGGRKKPALAIVIPQRTRLASDGSPYRAQRVVDKQGDKQEGGKNGEAVKQDGGKPASQQPLLSSDASAQQSEPAPTTAISSTSPALPPAPPASSNADSSKSLDRTDKTSTDKGNITPPTTSNPSPSAQSAPAATIAASTSVPTSVTEPSTSNPSQSSTPPVATITASNSNSSLSLSTSTASSDKSPSKSDKSPRSDRPKTDQLIGHPVGRDPSPQLNIQQTLWLTLNKNGDPEKNHPGTNKNAIRQLREISQSPAAGGLGYSLFRGSRGNGDCFYRSVFVGALSAAIRGGNLELMNVLRFAISGESGETPGGLSIGSLADEAVLNFERPKIASGPRYGELNPDEKRVKDIALHKFESWV